jgi:hypothetical protein
MKIYALMRPEDFASIHDEVSVSDIKAIMVNNDIGF